MKLENLIGDYQSFFSHILHRLKETGVDVTGLPMSHIAYRTATCSEYAALRDQIKTLCSEFVETQFNGRAVSILILKEPLILEDGFTISMIELPEPRSEHMYLSGLEHVGFVLGKSLPLFIEQYKNVLTGIKDHGVHCKPAFVTFDNDVTAKFYDIPLREIVMLQGWTIEKLIPNRCES